MSDAARGLLATLCCPRPSCAAAGAGAQPDANPEAIQIGLSTDRVSITADFTGADLTIFGALDNADPLVSRQGRYDVIVVLEGPARPVVVRRKDRMLGMWINIESETFVNVPVSYSVATTRMPQDITDPKSYKQLSLGADNIYLQPAEGDDPVTIEEFADALRDRKKATGLYSVRVGGVQFLSQTSSARRCARAERSGRHAQGARLPVQRRRRSFRRLRRSWRSSSPASSRSHLPHCRATTASSTARRRGACHVDRLARQHRLPQGLSLRPLSSEPAIAKSAAAADHVGHQAVAPEQARQ